MPLARTRCGAMRASSSTSNSTSAAAPAECASAATIGQPSTTFDKPLASCSNASSGQADAEAPQRLHLAAPQHHRQRKQCRQHDQRRDAVRHVDRDQRVERQVADAVRGAAEFAQQCEAVRSHAGRPPLAVAFGKTAARQHRVVGADPAAERDLQHEQCKHGNDAGRSAPALAASGRSRYASCCSGQQREQQQSAEQVQRDDRRVQLQRHRVLAEQPLHDHPHQRRRRPPRRKRQAATRRASWARP